MTRIGVFLVSGLMLAGCSTTKQVPGPTVTVTTTATSTVTQQVTVTASPSTDASGSVLALGKTFNGGDFKVTAYAYRRDAAPDAPAPESGRRWDAADVKVCVYVSDMTVSMSPWALLGNDEGLYEPSHTGYNQFPQPSYPFGDQPIGKGQCIRGWIVFDVTASVKVNAVQYSPQFTSGSTTIVTWRVG